MQAFPRRQNADKVCPQATRVLFLGSRGHLIMRAPATVRYEVTFFQICYELLLQPDVVSLCHSRQATLPGAVPRSALRLRGMFSRILARSLTLGLGAASPMRYNRGRYSYVRRNLSPYTIRSQLTRENLRRRLENLQNVHNCVPFLRA